MILYRAFTGRKSFTIIAFLLLTSFSGIFSESGNQAFDNPAEVARKVKANFKKLKSYKASFSMITKKGKKVSTMSGTCFYKKEGKIRFVFSHPSGDVIVSNGKKLWIYLRSLNAVGIQNLTLKKKSDGKSLFLGSSITGVDRLFRKYHHHFDKIDPPQPRMIDGRKYYVMKLTQMVKIGGFPNIMLYIDAKTYFIRKAVASNEYGLTTTLKLSNIKTNIKIADSKFIFKKPNNAKIVKDPLVRE